MLTELELQRLIKAAKTWDTEDYGYIKLTLCGRVLFTNNIDCDGANHWNKKAFDKLLKGKL